MIEERLILARIAGQQQRVETVTPVELPEELRIEHGLGKRARPFRAVAHDPPP
jgi:hypothetical protein